VFLIYPQAEDQNPLAIVTTLTGRYGCSSFVIRRCQTYRAVGCGKRFRHALRAGQTEHRRRYNFRVSYTPEPSRTFRLTLDLFETGVRLMRQNLRRADPRADEREIDRQLRTWLRERPGAEHGDSPGRMVDINTRLG